MLVYGNCFCRLSDSQGFTVRETGLKGLEVLDLGVIGYWGSLLVCVRERGSGAFPSECQELCAAADVYFWLCRTKVRDVRFTVFFRCGVGFVDGSQLS